jgi:Bacterial PH domain
MPDKAAPLDYRISPVQTALLILLAVPCAVLNLYFHPSGPARLVSLLIGVGAVVLAVVSYRMYLVVDDEGAAVRYLGREQWLPWDEVADVELVSGVRGSETIRFSRTDGTYVDVPPSLLQPTKPTARPVARRRLRDTLRQVQARRASA